MMNLDFINYSNLLNYTSLALCLIEFFFHELRKKNHQDGVNIIIFSEEEILFFLQLLMIFLYLYEFLVRNIFVF